MRARTQAHTHPLPKKKMSDGLPTRIFMYLDEQSVSDFSFGLGVARVGPYHCRNVDQWTRAYRSRFLKL